MQVTGDHLPCLTIKMDIVSEVEMQWQVINTCTTQNFGQTILAAALKLCDPHMDRVYVWYTSVRMHGYVCESAAELYSKAGRHN